MERLHTIRKHETSRRFGKRSHDCLNLHDSHCAATPTTSTKRCVGGNQRMLRIPIRKVPKKYPGGHCRYPGDQVPPRTSSRSRHKVRHANHTPLRVVNLGVNRMAQASSGAATCPMASAPTARPGPAPGPPRVLWPQLPLPGTGQLWGRCDRTTSKMRGFVSQDHIGGFSTKRECANTHK
jgi:hypothetical protein